MLSRIALPIFLVKSPIFLAVKSAEYKPAETFHVEKCVDAPGYWGPFQGISWNGAQLVQRDLDVLVGILELVDEYKSTSTDAFERMEQERNGIKVPKSRINQITGHGTPNLKALAESIEKLKSIKVEMRTFDMGRHAWPILEIEPDGANLKIKLSAEFRWTRSDLYVSERACCKELKLSLSKWLCRYLSTFKGKRDGERHVFKHKPETLKRLAGLGHLENKTFNKQLKAAIQELNKVKFLKSENVNFTKSGFSINGL